MKNILPAALLGMLFLTSCSSMYRTGQTPDDVYFSPARPASENVRRETEDTRDEYAYTEPDDNYLRMKVQNPNRWNTINDADYWYSYNRPYQYTHNNYNWNTWSYGFNNNPYWGNNYNYGYNNYGYNNYGNPYYYNKGYYGYQPGTVVRNLRSNTGPKPYMGGQSNTNYNNRNYGSGKNSSNLGNTLRNVFTPNNNTNTRTTTNSSGDTYSNPVRTITPSTPSTSTPSSSGNSSSGRSSGGTNSGGARPGRGN